MRKLYLILGSIGLGLLVISTIIILNTLHFQSSATLTEGIVTRLIESRSEEGTIMKAPVISFHSKDGQEYTYQSKSYSSPSTYSIGEKVPMYYEPTNPNNAQTGDMPFSITLAIIGGINLLVVLILYLVNLYIDRSQKLLRETGKKIKADIVSVKYNTSFSVGGKNPMIIECQWLTNHNNTVHVFKSINLWFDPSPYFGERKQLDVYINPNNPKKYFMDVSFLPNKG